MVVSYFSSLFSSSNLQVNFDEIFVHADFKEVLEFDWSFLNAPFTAEEVVLALKDVHLSKSPRLDGFHASFYHTYWNIIGHDFSELVLHYLNSDGDISALNATCITHIQRLKI